MDTAAMQNIFQYGNNSSAMGAAGGAPMSSPQADGSNMSHVQYPPVTDPSQTAYSNPLLSMGYGQAAAHAHAAAAMAEQRLAGYSTNGQAPAPGTTYPTYDPAMNVAVPYQYGTAPDGTATNGAYMFQRLQPAPNGTHPPPATSWINYGAHMAPPPQDSENGGYQTMAPWSVTSAGLFGKMNPVDEKKKSVRKKHKDKPKRPLSAYNIFFKEERGRILESIPSAKKQGSSDDESDLNRIGGGRKRKKTPHGKIGFESLAKIIGQRWQELNKEDKADKYKKLAAEDMKRYKEQMEIFLTKLEEEKKKKEGDGEEYVDEEREEQEEEEPEAKRAKTEEEKKEE